MKNTLAIAFALGLAACGDQPSLAPAAQAAPSQPAAIVAEPVHDADQALAERVMRAIDEAKLQGMDAVAADGVVTLWGTAVSAADRSRAAEVALRVQGVKAVENRLEIVSGS